MNAPQQPVIKLSLSVEQLRKLIPEGSEIEASLTRGVVENYSRAIADRMVRMLTQESNAIVQNVCLRLNGLLKTLVINELGKRTLKEFLDY